MGIVDGDFLNAVLTSLMIVVVIWVGVLALSALFLSGILRLVRPEWVQTADLTVRASMRWMAFTLFLIAVTMLIVLTPRLWQAGLGWQRIWELESQIAAMLEQGKYQEIIDRLQLSMLDDSYRRTHPFSATPRTGPDMSPMLYVMLAEAYAMRGETGDVDLSISACRKALRMEYESPSVDSRVSFRVGRLFIRFGMLDEGVNLLQEASVLSPDEPETWFELAKAYRQQLRMRQVQQALEKVVAIGKEPWVTKARRQLQQIEEQHKIIRP